MSVIERPLAAARAGPYTLLRLSLRELRGGLRGFTTFIACLALGVMTIAGVGSLAHSLTAGLAREGRAILGGARRARTNGRFSPGRAMCRRPPPCVRSRAPRMGARLWSS